jgi:3D (Asp-Asp-Asp) domain-containing protein
MKNKNQSIISLCTIIIGVGVFVLIYSIQWQNVQNELEAQNALNRSHKITNRLDSTVDWDPCWLNNVLCPDEEIEPRYRTVSAYNPVPEQTSGDPCIAASGVDICAGMDEGRKFVATNELPFGSQVLIAGEEYEVVDRTGSQYTYRYDIAFPADQIQEALAWGTPTLDVQIINQ